jgi:acetyl-CoA C-acetyltransferase
VALEGHAAIVGIAEWKPGRRPVGPARPAVEQWALLAREALLDAGIPADAADGVVTGPIAESVMFAPATVIEYLGIRANFAERLDLGGATAAGMVWRAAAAIEMGMANVVLCATPAGALPDPPGGAPSRGYFGASSELYGSPQAEFEIPYGNLAQNGPYAMFAQRYAAVYGYDARAMAKIAVDQRTNACSNPAAVFHGKPIGIDDVLASPVIADPLHQLEIVMPVYGGAAIVVAGLQWQGRGRHRPVRITGCGEHVEFKTPTYAADLLRTAVGPAAARAFGMAGIKPHDVDLVSLYDCYTITVLLALEDAGFCDRGAGAAFVNEHDLTFRGDFPCNTHGGQLSFGQPGMAGGMSHICEAARQIMRRAGANQVAECDTAFVTGNGGVMSEQVALVLQGA